jgi:hypothetical protein
MDTDWIVERTEEDVWRIKRVSLKSGGKGREET